MGLAKECVLFMWSSYEDMCQLKVFRNILSQLHILCMYSGDMCMLYTISCNFVFFAQTQTHLVRDELCLSFSQQSRFHFASLNPISLLKFRCWEKYMYFYKVTFHCILLCNFNHENKTDVCSVHVRYAICSMFI